MLIRSAVGLVGAYVPVPPVSVTCRMVVGALAATVMFAETLLPFAAAATPEMVTPSGGAMVMPVTNSRPAPFTVNALGPLPTTKFAGVMPVT